MRWLLRLAVSRLLLRLVMWLQRLWKLLSVARVVGTALWKTILIHLGQQGRHEGLCVLHHCVIHMKNAFQTCVTLSTDLFGRGLGLGPDFGCGFSLGPNFGYEGFAVIIGHGAGKTSAFLEVVGRVSAQLRLEIFQVGLRNGAETANTRNVGGGSRGVLREGRKVRRAWIEDKFNVRGGS
jgi:hypothetical protein